MFITGAAGGILCIATIHMAITLLMVAPGYVRCTPSNGGGRYMLVEEEEPPIVLAAAASSSKSVGLNELLLDIESTAPIAQPSLQVAVDAQPSLHHPTGQCRIEFQVTKVMPGWCTRLGRGSGRACISGNHMIPFHPECM